MTCWLLLSCSHWAVLRAAHDLFFGERYQQALELYDRCLRRDPTDINVMNNMAVCLIKVGLHNQGLDLVKRAIEINSTCPDLYLTAAFGLATMKEGSDHAIPFLRYTLSICPHCLAESASCFLQDRAHAAAEARGHCDLARQRSLHCGRFVNQFNRFAAKLPTRFGVRCFSVEVPQHHGFH